MTTTRGVGHALVRRDPVQLTNTVQAVLSDLLQQTVVVEDVSRSASPFASLCPAEVVTARLRGDRSHLLFLKSLGDEDADHPDKQRRDRELLVYADLFAGRVLPVPRWLGGGWNPAIRRHDLYLEHVDDWDLRYQDLEYWYLAAGHLGELHRAFAEARDDLLAGDYLLRLDTQYFNAWAQRALEAVRWQSTRLGRRHERVVEAFRPGAELLAVQPPTLVHNDLSPKNVLVDRSAQPVRTCFVDWEMAGIGCGLLDLVHLKYGLEPAEEAKLCARYHDAAGGGDVLPRQEKELMAVMAACQIHETNVRLWRSPRWSLPERRLEAWIDEAETALERMR
ncbi:phosphotransferase family enzyme [Micromonospora kangleipakensis]|uniref:Phosphotransferase family enzyme n=1 Tax=Micromonospora kangleipakensis TaxID=1077942 RepID=A0A4V2GDG0_9ACTN|nr:phosphotransferase family enzyme [Micromonospora kangleipakensis]